MGDVKNGYQATPNTTLEQQMMDACAPKNEREWWAAEEITRLRAEVESLKARIATRCDFARLLIQKDAMLDIAQGSLDAARAEAEALRADLKRTRGEFEKAWPDAERYRWLRNKAGRGAAGSIFDNFNGSAVDECIDAARAAQGDKP